jgi:aryl-alcohol dehydrogenase-like predicted oxidoreductase
MSWGYPADGPADDPGAVIGAALDRGMTLIDTAAVYGPYTSERLVGRAVRNRRDEAVLCTKGGCTARDPADPHSIEIDGSPANLRADCEASLQRLGVDYIDLYYLHRLDPNIPIEESIGALAELRAEGKIRAIGLSECNTAALERAARVSPIAAVQSEFSLWTRDHVHGSMRWCNDHDAAFVAFAPLGRGFLAGRVHRSLPPDDLRSRMPRFQSSALEHNVRLLTVIETIAAEHGLTLAQVALAWVLQSNNSVIPIAGTRRLAGIRENALASEVTLLPEAVAQLDQLHSGVVGSRYGSEHWQNQAGR